MNTNFNMIMQIIIIGSVGLLCFGPVWSFSKKILRFFLVKHQYATEFIVLFGGCIVCFGIIYELSWQKIPMAFPNMRTPLIFGVIFFAYMFLRWILYHLRDMDRVLPVYDEEP